MAEPPDKTCTVEDTLKELVQYKNKSRREESPIHESEYFTYSRDELEEFLTCKDVSITRLMHMADQVKLKKTSTGRYCSGDRVGFGLSRTVTKVLNDHKVRKTMFFFNRCNANGLYSGSTSNVEKIAEYLQLANEFRLKVSKESHEENPSIREPISWSEGDVNQLIRSRSQVNPPTFRAIANELNTFYERSGLTPKNFTTVHCVNKWHRLFPSEEDAFMTVEFLRKLKRKWPGMKCISKLDPGETIDKPPVLTSLHIVWPWSQYVSNVLGRSIFCDATYQVTVFNYKVVSITTLDGNKQHRPLMVSFLSTLTATQWCIVFDIFHDIVRDSDVEVHVVTSDQEKAIRGGLRLSTFSTSIVMHFICSLHVKWNVRDHICSNGIRFGVQASEAWSKLMQWADASGSFNKGYQKMKEKYSEDGPRLEYIEKLFEDPRKALFKQEWTFTNAVVVDVCESLFSALKGWTSGNRGKSVSLLMAVARIVEGVRQMMLKPFRYDYGKSFLTKTAVHQPPILKYVFQHLVKHLTKRSVEIMFDGVTKSLLNYDVVYAPEFISVKCRRSGDEFVVDVNYRCWTNHTPCWLQQYTGLPCKHTLLAVFQKIQRCEDEDEKETVLHKLVEGCHKNWLLSTYSDQVLSRVPIPGPPPSVRDVVNSEITPEKQVWMNRFQEVIKYVPAEFVRESLDVLERKALSESDEDEEVVMNETEDSNSDSEEETSDTEQVSYVSIETDKGEPLAVRNPPKRKPASQKIHNHGNNKRAHV